MRPLRPAFWWLLPSRHFRTAFLPVLAGTLAAAAFCGDVIATNDPLGPPLLTLGVAAVPLLETAFGTRYPARWLPAR